MRTFLKSFIEKRPAVHRIYSIGTMIDGEGAILRDDFLSHTLYFINSGVS